ncbi:hypothetical protein Ciccas_007643 [Cichlidogyrus casuarinus]|uniref:Bromo domain-containing protein n=1 Tax=Cichlidogyrus casuarinus TaxID=1844966 RepID=A0ABD2Q3Q2_9PLAT
MVSFFCYLLISQDYVHPLIDDSSLAFIAKNSNLISYVQNLVDDNIKYRFNAFYLVDTLLASQKCPSRLALEPKSAYEKVQLNNHILGHRSSIFGLLVDKRGEYIITGSDDHTLKIWSLIKSIDSVKPILTHTLRGHVAEIIDLCLSIDNHLLVSVDYNCILVVWCMKTGQPVASLNGPKHLRNVSGLYIFVEPTEESACSNVQNCWIMVSSYCGGLNYTCCSIELKPSIHFAASKNEEEFLSFSLSPGGSHMAIGTSIGNIIIYGFPELAAAPMLLSRTEPMSGSINNISFSNRDLNIIASSTTGDLLWLWKVCRPTMLAWSMDDTYIIVSAKFGQVFVYDAWTREFLTLLEGHDGIIFSLAPSPLDPDILVTGGVDGRLIVWHIKRKIQLYSYLYPPGHIDLTEGIVWELPAGETFQPTPASTQDLVQRPRLKNSQRISNIVHLPTHLGVGFLAQRDMALMVFGEIGILFNSMSQMVGAEAHIRPSNNRAETVNISDEAVPALESSIASSLNTMARPPCLLLEVLHSPSQIPFSLLPPAYLINIHGFPHCTGRQRQQMVGRRNLARDSDLKPTLSVDECDINDVIIDDIQFAENVPGDYYANQPVKAHENLREEEKRYLWRCPWLNDYTLIEPIWSTHERRSLFLDCRQAFQEELNPSLQPRQKLLLAATADACSLFCQKISKTLAEKPTPTISISDPPVPEVTSTAPAPMGEDSDSDSDEDSDWNQNEDVSIGWWYHRKRQRRRKAVAENPGLAANSSSNMGNSSAGQEASEDYIPSGQTEDSGSSSSTGSSNSASSSSSSSSPQQEQNGMLRRSARQLKRQKMSKMRKQRRQQAHSNKRPRRNKSLPLTSPPLGGYRGHGVTELQVTQEEEENESSPGSEHKRRVTRSLARQLHVNTDSQDTQPTPLSPKLPWPVVPPKWTGPDIDWLSLLKPQCLPYVPQMHDTVNAWANQSVPAVDPPVNPMVLKPESICSSTACVERLRRLTDAWPEIEASQLPVLELDEQIPAEMLCTVTGIAYHLIRIASGKRAWMRHHRWRNGKRRDKAEECSNIECTDSFVRLVTLRLETEDGRKLLIRYHDMDGILDFLVPTAAYEKSLEQSWSVGDQFMASVGEKGEWWLGEVTGFVDQPDSKSSDHWLAIQMKWAPAEPSSAEEVVSIELASPWDLYPICYENGDELGLSKRQICQLFGSRPLSDHHDYRNEHMNASHIVFFSALLHELFLAEHLVKAFAVPVDLAAYPDYILVNPMPVDLTFVQARLGNGFYRNVDAFLFDLVLMTNNTLRYNRPNSTLVSQAEHILRLLLQAVMATLQGEDTASLMHTFKQELASDSFELPEPNHQAIESSFEAEKQIPGPSTALNKCSSEEKDEEVDDDGEESDDTRRYKLRRSKRHRRLVMREMDEHSESELEIPQIRVNSRYNTRLRKRVLPNSSKGRASSSVRRSSRFRRIESDESTQGQNATPSSEQSEAQVDTTVDWRTQVDDQLQTIFCSMESKFFIKPVDTDTYQDYLDYVDEPMDLGLIVQRVKTGKMVKGQSCSSRQFDSMPNYSPSNCLRDLYLVVANSEAYNTDPNYLIFEHTQFMHRWLQNVMEPILVQSGASPPSDVNLMPLQALSPQSDSSSNTAILARPKSKRQRRAARSLEDTSSDSTAEIRISTRREPRYKL